MGAHTRAGVYQTMRDYKPRGCQGRKRHALHRAFLATSASAASHGQPRHPKHVNTVRSYHAKPHKHEVTGGDGVRVS